MTTNFLVAGENSDKWLQQATNYGVIILSENKLIEFIRMPTTTPVKPDISTITPTVPAMTARPPVPKATSARMRRPELQGVNSERAAREGVPAGFRLPYRARART